MSESGYGGVPSTSQPKPRTLIDLFDLILRHLRLIFAVAVILSLAAATQVLLKPPVYTSSASFLPQASSNSQSALSGVASQLGLVTSGDQSGQSPDFYVSLLQQQSMLVRVVDARYSLRAAAQPQPLPDILLDEGGSPAERRRRAMDILNTHTTIALNAKIGLVRIVVSSDDPDLSKQIVDNYLRFVNESNRDILRQRATEEARFIDDRLAATRSELFAAEDRLQFFLQTNRELSNSSELVFQRDRLQRDVQLRQQIYSSLAQAYEQSRLDQVRDTPVITLVERPFAPQFPDSRHVGVRVILAALLGGLIGILIARLSELVYAEDGSLAPSGEFQRLLTRLRRRIMSARGAAAAASRRDKAI